MKLVFLCFVVSIAVTITVFGCGKRTISKNKKQPWIINQVPLSPRAILEIVDSEGNIEGKECKAYFMEMDASDSSSENYTTRLVPTEAHCIVISDPPLVYENEMQTHSHRKMSSVRIRFLSTGARLENNPVSLMDNHKRYVALDNRHNPDRLRDGTYKNDIALVLLKHDVFVKRMKTPYWVRKYENDTWFENHRQLFIELSRIG